MSSWEVEFLEEAVEDLRRIKEPIRTRVLKAIRKVAQNPLPQAEGGYGKPLGNKGGLDLTGLMKVKLRSDGIRIVYRVVREGQTMKVVVIGARSDEQVYREAHRRKRKHGDL